jgi:penicillin-binding protein 2
MERSLVTDEDHPLLNKAIQAQLAPGSTFKIIMATAGLQEGIAQDMHVNCGGGANFYGRYFKCWVVAEHRVHGSVDINKAIYQSCDVFFYTLAERLGIDKHREIRDDARLGAKTGIDLPQEVTGVMPSEEWKIQELQAEMVCRRNDFCRHRTGRSRPIPTSSSAFCSRAASMAGWQRALPLR